MTAAGYTRVSTGQQETEGSSLSSQEEAIRKHARKLKLDLGMVYSDTFSGALLYERPQLSALREAVARKEITALIVYALDRLSREPVHQMIIADECHRHGVQLISVTEDLEHTPEGLLITHVRSYAAQLERAKIMERSMRGKLHHAHDGKIVTRAPFGYDQFRNVRTINEDEAAIVREIFELAAAGESTRLIAKTMGWPRNSVAKLLQRTTYKGELTMRFGDEQINVPTPAIVDADLWERAQRTDTAPKTRNLDRPFLLRGVIWCNVCGQRLYCETSKGTRYYRCSSRDKQGRCGAGLVNADVIERALWTDIRATLDDPERILEALSQAPDQTDSLRTKIAALESRLKKVDAGIGRMLAALRSVDGIEDDVQKQVADAARQKAVIRTQLDAAQRSLAHATATATTREAIRREVKRLQRSLRWPTFETQRAAMELLQVQVWAGNDTYEAEAALPEAEVSFQMRSRR